MTTEDLQKDMENLAFKVVKDIKSFIDIDLDFSPGSLAAIEGYLSYLYDEMKGKKTFFTGRDKYETEKHHIAVEVGAYVGECLKRVYSGTWEYAEGLGITLVFPGGVISPQAKVLKRLVNGEDDNVEVYFHAVGNLLKAENSSG